MMVLITRRPQGVRSGVLGPTVDMGFRKRIIFASDVARKRVRTVGRRADRCRVLRRPQESSPEASVSASLAALLQVAEQMVDVLRLHLVDVDRHPSSVAG
jgi:hypothetical protein